MSMLPDELIEASAWSDDLELFRCPRCAGRLVPAPSRLSCAACDAEFPIRNGILVIKEQSDLNNGVAQEFYDSLLWPKFRFWEKFTWWCNGGEHGLATRFSNTFRSYQACNCSTWPWVTEFTFPGCRPTGRSSASTYPGRSLRPAEPVRPGPGFVWSRAKPRRSRFTMHSLIRC